VLVSVFCSTFVLSLAVLIIRLLMGFRAAKYRISGGVLRFCYFENSGFIGVFAYCGGTFSGIVMDSVMFSGTALALFSSGYGGGYLPMCSVLFGVMALGLFF